MEQGERFREAPSVEDRYRILVEGITDYAIYMLDSAGLVTSWNRGAERSKGYNEGEIIGEYFSRFYTEEDPQTALRTAREQGRFEQEGWRVRKDGTRFWAHVIIDALRDPNGNLLGYAKITRDLSERRRAEEELRQSQDQLRLLVQSVTDYALYMLDLDGRVSSWNAGAERIKGYTRDEILGHHFSRFYRNRLRSISWRAAYARSSTNKKSEAVPVVARGLDQSGVWTLFNAVNSSRLSAESAARL